MGHRENVAQLSDNWFEPKEFTRWFFSRERNSKSLRVESDSYCVKCGSRIIRKVIRRRGWDEIRVACWQGTTDYHSIIDIRKHAQSAVRKIEAASFACIQLLVFPELYLNGLPLLKTLDSSCDYDTEALEMITIATGSAGVAVVMGYAKRSNSCTGIYNSAIAFHADGTVPRTNATKFVLPLITRRNCLPLGDEESWKAFDLKVKHRVVRCGICICSDSDIRTSNGPSRIARDGAEVLLVPMAALSTGVDDFLSFDCVAKKNNLYVLRANIAHDDRFDEELHCGKSCISHKNGHIITKAGMKEERHVTYQLQLAEKDACGQTANAMKLGTRVNNIIWRKNDMQTNATIVPNPEPSSAAAVR